MALARPLPPHARAPQVARLADGRRLHLQDGPIDLVIEADGPAGVVEAAYAAAAARFAGLLDELCAELPVLRAPAEPDASPLQGTVARRMWEAVRPFADAHFITPMAAVAGAVAEEVLAAMVRPRLTRAYVNNGGDIAIHLEVGAAFAVGLVDRPDQPRMVGTALLQAADPVRGVATSGWRGRSFSLGIADAVTVLATTASRADAAATIIANAVDLPGHPGILRVPAAHLQPDSDLGDRLVTRAVPELSSAERTRALEAGLARAQDLVRRGLIQAAALHLQGENVSTGAQLNLNTPLPAPAGDSLAHSQQQGPSHA